MDRFVYSLRKIPRFEVRLGKLSYMRGEFVQKRVDVLLSVDLVRMSWGRQIQRAVLLSGDSDLVPAVQAAKEAGIPDTGLSLEKISSRRIASSLRRSI